MALRCCSAATVARAGNPASSALYWQQPTVRVSAWPMWKPGRSGDGFRGAAGDMFERAEGDGREVRHLFIASVPGGPACRGRAVARLRGSVLEREG